MPRLARHLQDVFIRDCPSGWACSPEVSVVPKEMERWLGYAPQADVMLREVKTGRRVWVELEISRADPVANHAKFATAHLFQPMPQQDTFVSMVSRHVDRGRSNLAAHTIALMRTLGIRAFQTILLPTVERDEIKRLNHLTADRLREEAPVVGDELKRVLSVSGAVGRVLESDIHFAANAVEVLYNVQRWNQDMALPALRERWGQRRVRYFAYDPRTRLFAPSKFAAYLRLPLSPQQAWLQERSLTGMSIASYTEIDQQHPLFDGRRAWQHLETQLRMVARPIETQPEPMVDAFWRWSERFKDAITVDAKGPVILCPPVWMC
jgi:hypothetical protein